MKVVYFIQSGSDGPIKIGRSNDVAGRLRLFQTGSSAPLTLLATIATEDAKKLEGDLHERFSANGIGGEWFRPCPELLELIAASDPPKGRRTLPRRGGRPARGRAPAQVIALRVAPSELAEWKRAADGRPLSAWIREVCNTPEAT